MEKIIESNIQLHRERTEQDILRKLKTYGICAEIRPPYFGKTYGAVKLAIENYQNILYLYPNESIREGAIEQICNFYGIPNDKTSRKMKDRVTYVKNFAFMTYNKLIRLTDEDFRNMPYDLIILDEMHVIGARCTSRAITMLKQEKPESHILGMTATPDRTDAIDVIERFFDNVLVYPYNFHDAIEDGIILKPYYVYCAYDRVGQITTEVLEEFKKKSWKATKETALILERKALEFASLYNIPNIIKGACEESKSPNYLKFICFFNSFEHIKEKHKEIENWFKEAYPNYSLKTITITSENTVTKANVNKLKTLHYQENHIDLIYCVNMLNLGYHVDDLTGIIMYRCTSSNIVYIQQLGRALFSHKHGLVIDIVNNIKRKALYDNYCRAEELSYKERQKMEQQANGTWSDTYITTDSEGNEIELDKSLILDKDTNEIRVKWQRQYAPITADDFILTGIEAKRKDLEKKIIAESFAQVAHKFLLNYFKIWCEKIVHIPFPISVKQMELVYGYTREEFVEWFDNVLVEENITFPYHTLKNFTKGDILFKNLSAAYARTSRVNIEEIYDYYE